jgi:hypothetical protein
MPPGARRQPNSLSYQANPMSAEETCQIDVIYSHIFKMKYETFHILPIHVVHIFEVLINVLKKCRDFYKFLFLTEGTHARFPYMFGIEVNYICYYFGWFNFSY